MAQYYDKLFDSFKLLNETFQALLEHYEDLVGTGEGDRLSAILAPMIERNTELISEIEESIKNE